MRYININEAQQPGNTKFAAVPLMLSKIQSLTNKKQTIIYGLMLAVVLIILKWLQITYIFADWSLNLYTASIAIIFTITGIWAASNFIKPKVKFETIVVEKDVFITKSEEFVFDEAQFNRSGLSNRELEVLQQMAKGLSNQEIADKMFVSLNTIKTHSSNIYLKLDVSRRTQAVDKAKKLSLIP